MMTALIFMIRAVNCGPIAAGSAIAYCYTACNAGYVACLAGVVTAPLCSVVQGACMAACFTAGLAAPTP
jgi:mannitol-specific phosphotransferase system IIBC component